MRAAIYARVSTDSQQQRGTIGSQLAALRARVAEEGDECIAEFCDDGHSGARLDRPGLDGLRDAAEAGLIERVWCLSPDRLARVYAYQVIVLDELARHRVTVAFADAPPLDDDPQSKLLTQVQGVIAEYERAKIAERYRRGKLFRSRAGEVLAWRTPYGYRRLPRDSAGQARLEVYEPEATVVRRIFDDTVAGGHSTREIARRLAADQVPTPKGRAAVWGTSTIGRLLRNEAYVGRVYFNRTESVPDPRPGRKNKQVPRPRQEWIEIAVPAIISDEVFAAAERVSHDNSQWSPRRAEPGQWLLKGLVRCGACGVGTNCHKMRGRNGTWHRYYYCRNHDPIRAGGQDRRCPERNIRSDALDAFVFDQVRAALLRPDTLLAGEHAVAASTPTADDELLANELARLDRKLTAADDERRRLADLYQAGLLTLPEVQRRAADVEHRRRDLTDRRDNLTAQRRELTRDNQLRHRVAGFSQRVLSVIDHLDDEQKQTLLRLVVDEVRVTGWNVEVQLRIPLDDPGDAPPPPHPPEPADDDQPPLSTEDRLRSLGGQRERLLWETGVLDQLPPGVGHPILDVHQDGTATVTVMRDLGQTIPGWSRVLDTGECLRVIGALTRLHATFLDHAPPGLCPLETRLTVLSPEVMSGATGEHPLAELVLRGWEHFAELVEPDIVAAVASIHADPAPMATAMRSGPTTLLHADLWLVNLALADQEVVFLDWAMATEGPPAFDLAVFLTGSSAHVEPSREDLIEVFMAQSTSTDQRAMDLALLAGLVDLGWNKALDAAEHTDPAMRARARADLDWWVRQGSRRLDRL